ncbi:MAG: ECF-type sigma factor [Phycisphaerales bacterium]|nr:ECF-type sigma factor [Phycisphaerales bacterium]
MNTEPRHIPTGEHGDVTRLIALASSGDRGAEERLLETVYTELHAIAQRAMRGERVGITVGATAVVNEAYMRLFRPGGDASGGVEDWSSRRAFFDVAAQAMRRVLIDHARRRSALARGGSGLAEPRARAPEGGRQGRGSRVPLDVLAAAQQSEPGELLALSDQILRLESVDPRAAEVVRLRFYAGLSVEQAALVLGLSERTVKRDWELARAWLQTQMVTQNVERA